MSSFDISQPTKLNAAYKWVYAFNSLDDEASLVHVYAAQPLSVIFQ